MFWMEMIRLRTVPGKEEGLMTLLAESVRQISDSEGLAAARILTNTVFQGDFALNLTWETAHPESRGSKAGLGIASALRAYGLVEHSVWTEEKLL